MKTTNGIIIIVVIILALIVGGITLASYRGSSPSNNQPSPSPQPSPIPSKTLNPSPNTQTTPLVKTYNVDIKNFAFSPKALTIKKGDKVVWTNSDSAGHTVTSDSGSEINSNNLANGETYSHTFNNAGTYNYHCTIHPMMKATIIVE